MENCIFLFIIVLGELPYVKVVDNFDAEYEVMW